MLGQVADILTARGALAAAHAGTRLPGSSTACVVRLNRPARTIDAANLVRFTFAAGRVLLLSSHSRVLERAGRQCSSMISRVLQR